VLPEICITGGSGRVIFILPEIMRENYQ